MPMTEAREMMTTARTFLNEGNFVAAFELAQEAAQLIQMVSTVQYVTYSCLDQCYMMLWS